MALDAFKLARNAAGGGFDPRVSIVAGAGSATDLTLTGIDPGDGLLAVLEFLPPNVAQAKAVSVDHVANTTIPASDAIRIAGTVNTTGNQVIVFWYKFTP